MPDPRSRARAWAKAVARRVLPRGVRRWLRRRMAARGAHAGRSAAEPTAPSPGRSSSEWSSPGRSSSGRSRPGRSTQERAAAEATSHQDWPEAEARWQAVLEQAGDRVPPRVFVNLALAQRRQKRWRDAEATAQRGHRSHPDSERLARELAEIAMGRRRWEEAEDRWSTALRLTDQPALSSYLGLSAAQRHTGRFDAAEDTMGQAARHHPGAAKVAVELGEIATRRGELALAAERWREALRACGDRPPTRVFVRLCTVLRGQGDLDGAEAAAHEGLEVRPRDPRLAREVAEALGRRRDFQGAIDWWQRALTWAGGRMGARWHFRHGAALEACERYEEALDSYEHALEELGDVEQPWALEAAVTWRFRRAYVRRRLGHDGDGDPRLDCVVTADGDRETEQDTTRGEFHGQVTHKGIRVNGVVHEPDAGTVEVLVDDRVIKAVAVDRTVAPPYFALHLKHGTLTTFPPRSSVTVRTLTGPLAADGVRGALRLDVPHGRDTLGQVLADGVVITKKGTLFDASRFEGEGAREQMERYAQLRHVVEEETGASLFLLYGTLLGYHRDGAFIKGDDDIDVGYLTDATNPEEVKAHGIDLAHRLLRAGYDVGTRFGGGLLQVLVDGVSLDVYPIWFFRGRAWGYDAIDARRDRYEPTHTGTFHGVEVVVPHDPATLLAQTYGPDWRTPDPSFSHVRSAEVLEVLQMSALTPSQAREIARANARDRARDPAVGTFNGAPDPGRQD